MPKAKWINPNIWDNWEVEFVKSNYLTMAYGDIASTLVKTEDQVTHLLEFLGLKKRFVKRWHQTLSTHRTGNK